MVFVDDDDDDDDVENVFEVIVDDSVDGEVTTALLLPSRKGLIDSCTA